MSYKSALEFHDCLDNELKLINLKFFFSWEDVVVSEDLLNKLVELHEGCWKSRLNILLEHHTAGV
jgi:hypothetical protein